MDEHLEWFETQFGYENYQRSLQQLIRLQQMITSAIQECNHLVQETQYIATELAGQRISLQRAEQLVEEVEALYQESERLAHSFEEWGKVFLYRKAHTPRMVLFDPQARDIFEWILDALHRRSYPDIRKAIEYTINEGCRSYLLIGERQLEVIAKQEEFFRPQD